MEENEVNKFLVNAYNAVNPNHPYINFSTSLLEELIESYFKTTLSGLSVSVEKVFNGDWEYEGSIYAVFKIGEEYFKYTGYRSSWDGSNWGDSPTKVTPRVETVLHWE